MPHYASTSLKKVESSLPASPNRSSPELVRFENVGLRYGVGAETLTDLNFTIEPQSFQFLTGASGTGKTTLLRLILQALKPTRGTVVLFGQDTSLLPKEGITTLRRRMGIVFQDFRLLDHLTTYENVALPLKVQGRDEATYRAEVMELLSWVGLGELIHAKPALLSGGEKQRASIARALVTQPELLLADEPTGNVDPSLARRLLRLFVEMNRSGTAILIATHDLGLMDQIEGARRLVLSDRRLYIGANHV
jgi:cell division transport system ATP-binding protein